MEHGAWSMEQILKLIVETQNHFGYIIAIVSTIMHVSSTVLEKPQSDSGAIKPQCLRPLIALWIGYRLMALPLLRLPLPAFFERECDCPPLAASFRIHIL